MSRFIVRLNRVDLLTLSGVVTSALAIASALNGYLYLATALLFIAMLGDALDGIWARKRNITRNFGRYLDGFMDTLIYLVAPALILYANGFSGFWSLFLLAMIMAGCIRLAVFNDIGNITEETASADKKLAYLGMPVFWSVFILAGFLLLENFLPLLLARALLALSLAAFSVAMLLNRPFLKFRALWQILALTLGGAALFLTLQALTWLVSGA